MPNKIKYEAYIDTIKRRTKPWPITRIAYDYGLSAQELNKLLLRVGIIRKTTNDNRQYILLNNSYGELKDFSKVEQQYIGTTKHAVDYLHRDTVVYNQFGMLAIYNALNKIGIKPINELFLEQEIDMSNLNIKPTDLCLIRRPGIIGQNASSIAEQKYYISYFKNMNSTDHFGIDYQYLTEQRYNTIAELMTNTKLSAETTKAGLRLDNRDSEAYKKVTEDMNNYYNLYYGYEDSNFEYKQACFIEQNKLKCKEYLGESHG